MNRILNEGRLHKEYKLRRLMSSFTFILHIESFPSRTIGISLKIHACSHELS